MLIPAPPPDLGLAYANTLGWRGRDVPTETLTSLAGLAEWLQRSAGIYAGAFGDMDNWSRAHPRAAAHNFVQAIEIREALYRMFRAVAAGKAVREADFAVLQRALQQAPARNRPVRSVKGYGWDVGDVRRTPAHLLAPVLWSAADLLLANSRMSIRQCANGECLWLFLDESKNGTRRWCDMAACGNRAKARRHYLRTKDPKALQTQ
jgi:predicted RNA-binding Zn ribbon-like protein